MGVILVFIYLLGVYTGVILYLTPTLFIPTFIAGCAAILLLLKNIRRVQKSHLKPMFGLLVIALLTLFFAPNREAYFIERFKGFISLAYALVSAYVLFLEMSRWDRRAVARVFGVFSVLIIVGCLFENYTDFRDVSDAFRSEVFKQDLYGGLYRDYTQFGMIRPKLFTAEPSHVAKFFLFSVTMWLALTQRRKKYLKLIVMMGVGFFLIRSPIVLLAVPSALLLFVYLDYGGVRKLLSSAGIEGTFKLSILGISLGIGLIVAFQTILAPRIELIMTGRDTSFIGRILAPPVVTYHTLRKSPYFGAGIEGKEAIVRELTAAFASFGMIQNVRGWDFDILINRIANVFWLHWIYFGLIGGIFAAYMIGRLMKNLGGTHYILCIALVLMFSQTMGGYVSVKIWTFVLMIFLISTLHDRNDTNISQKPSQLYQKKSESLPSPHNNESIDI